jgi:hypothetical protein
LVTFLRCEAARLEKPQSGLRKLQAESVLEGLKAAQWTMHILLVDLRFLFSLLTAFWWFLEPVIASASGEL